MKTYDVAIIGSGVTGSALLYVLSKYSSVKSIALIEKYSELASVQSAKNNNSQTLHFGDIETNYTVDKARSVKEAAEMVKVYVENHEGLHKKFQKMVLAVGENEIKRLEQRYEDFKE
ncbi:FAD-dependent oxidoreductase, partial [Candidatus Woesearchaeota archaeon]|nr:FAD-dependent oxidoreductase [Candidatus Woesearchaeota archaeon]